MIADRDAFSRGVQLRGGMWLSALAAMLTPGDCRLCDAPLTEARACPICLECLHSICKPAAVRAAACAVCGDTLPPDSLLAGHLYSERERVCEFCTNDRPAFVRAVAGGSYNDLRPAIHLLKFESVRSLAAPLSESLAEAMLSLERTAPRKMTVVPVPLFRGKRPFNQSALLTERALRILRCRAPEWTLEMDAKVLRRIRRTESQFLLSREERRKNVRGAFAAGGSVFGRAVLLVDDVYTSGATANECARVLLQAGAASVHVATLARASREMTTPWTTNGARDAPTYEKDRATHNGTN